MPAPFGVTATGFSKKTLEEVLADLKAALHSQISPTLNLTSTSILGVFVGVVAERIAEVWDVAEAVYDSRSPDGAIGLGLDQVSAITGTLREGARPSTVSENLDLDAATTVPVGSIVAVAGNPTAQFRTLAAVTSVLAGVYPVEMESVDDGPVVANAGTLTVIVTPVTGWNSATNPLDADLGADVESDPHLRLKREEELRQQGTTPVDALRADLLALEGVEQVRIYENVGHAPDADGVPGHAFEAVVIGGVDAVVAQAIWDGKATGINTHGTSSEVVEDTAGGEHDVEFTRPVEVDIWVAVTVLVDPDLFPVDGDLQIQEAIVALGDLSEIGEDVIRTRFYAPALSIPGVLDVTVLKVDDVDPPVSTGNVVIGSRQIATFDTSRVEVTVT